MNAPPFRTSQVPLIWNLRAAARATHASTRAHAIPAAIARRSRRSRRIARSPEPPGVTGHPAHAVVLTADRDGIQHLGDPPMAQYMYEPLSAQDHSFLVMETPNLHMHVASTQIFELGPL